MPDWYVNGGHPNAASDAENIRDEFVAIETAHGKLPNYGSNNGRSVWTSSGQLGAKTAAEAREALGLTQRTRVTKSADTSRVSSAYTADPHIAVTLEAGKRYEIDMGILYQAAGPSSELRINMGYSGTQSSFSMVAVARSVNCVNVTLHPGLAEILPGVAGTLLYMICQGTIVTATAGDLSLIWAESGGVSMTIKEDSWLSYREIV